MNNEITEIKNAGCYVGLTHDLLNLNDVVNRVRSPQAGAIVMFAGQLVLLLFATRTLRILTFFLPVS